MKPIVQSILMDGIEPGTADAAVEAGHPAGDCLRACVASIFEFDLDDVPHFVQYRGGDNLLWWWALIGWCHETGVEVLYIEGDQAPGGWSLAAGQSPRGHSHVCVAYDGIVVHDPHPSGDGLASIEHYYALLPGEKALAEFEPAEIAS